MPFTLRVQFTGLCLHVVDAERGVGVVLPDGRMESEVKRHFDNTDAVPHVGYLRMDLGSIVGTRPETVVPSGKPLPIHETHLDDGPPFEVVYRFRGDTLDFVLPPAGPVKVGLKLPSFDQFAPHLRLNSSLFAPAAGGAGSASPILMRTALSGGELIAPDGDDIEEWSMDPWVPEERPFGGKMPSLVAPLRGDAVWTREVKDADSLVLTLTEIGGERRARIHLRPVPTKDGQVISLKVANLCAENPMEWAQLDMRSPGVEDSDFKWLYRLFEVPQPSWPAVLKGCLLPAPRVATQKVQKWGGPPHNCGGAIKSGSVPDIRTW